ncbi:MAG: hypothetical protein ABI881_01085 [Betaproteobacteria bacterium]
MFERATGSLIVVVTFDATAIGIPAVCDSIGAVGIHALLQG